MKNLPKLSQHTRKQMLIKAKQGGEFGYTECFQLSE